MRASALVSATVFLATFVNAYYEPAIDAREVDYILERRELLGELSTRDLISELSNRLERRHKSKTCSKCGATIGDAGTHRC
ncbi:hypothetical protein DFP72DRAFT_1076250 [Ephemerocybe angulata]|uniref:Uncharacterized protein n=1 Tax=Ephemerocybe angulata TaxID=980116 RepID=A0A8H6HHS7_9AGAR|nr:hypothetical protein DFP72DRAFT_1076250 [Tulosesus angulatus]